MCGMKFIRLMRFDNKPVWLNAGFVVTVEPRRDGVGSVVVPIGDGLDYDVRESPEEVLKMLADEPAPAVVPVPVSDGLAPPPKDVSPEPEPSREQSPREEAPAPKAAEPKKPRRRTAKTEGDVSKPAAKKAAERKTAKKIVAPLEISDEQIERLVKLSPKTEDKLKNTLLTQFHIADVVATVRGLEEKGVFTRDGKRVVWSSRLTACPDF